MTLSVAKGVVSGPMAIDQPVAVTGDVAGTLKGDALMLDYAFHDQERSAVHRARDRRREDGGRRVGVGNGALDGCSDTPLDGTFALKHFREIAPHSSRAAPAARQLASLRGAAPFATTRERTSMSARDLLVHGCRSALWFGGFGQSFSKHLSGAIVRVPRLVQLARPNLRRLLRPALIHGLQAPLGASARGADRLAADEREDRVGVRRGQDARGDPAAPIDRDVERQRLDAFRRRRCSASRPTAPLTTISTGTCRVSPIRARSTSQYGFSS